MKIGTRRTAKVWWHRSRAIVWLGLTLAALRWWPNSVAFVIIASGYANVVTDWTAGAAVDNREIIEHLNHIKRKIDSQ